MIARQRASEAGVRWTTSHLSRRWRNSSNSDDDGGAASDSDIGILPGWKITQEITGLTCAPRVDGTRGCSTAVATLQLQLSGSQQEPWCTTWSSPRTWSSLLDFSFKLSGLSPGEGSISSPLAVNAALLDPPQQGTLPLPWIPCICLYRDCPSRYQGGLCRSHQWRGRPPVGQ